VSPAPKLISGLRLRRHSPPRDALHSPARPGAAEKAARELQFVGWKHGPIHTETTRARAAARARSLGMDARALPPRRARRLVDGSIRSRREPAHVSGDGDRADRARGTWWLYDDGGCAAPANVTVPALWLASRLQPCLDPMQYHDVSEDTNVPARFVLVIGSWSSRRCSGGLGKDGDARLMVRQRGHGWKRGRRYGCDWRCGWRRRRGRISAGGLVRYRRGRVANERDGLRGRVEKRNEIPARHPQRRHGDHCDRVGIERGLHGHDHVRSHGPISGNH
jgi:hypothetical protein